MSIVFRVKNSISMLFLLLVTALSPGLGHADDTLEKYLITTFGKLSKQEQHRALALHAELEIKKTSLVNTPTFTDIIPEYTSKGLTFRFVYSAEALKNPGHFLRELITATALVRQFRDPQFSVAWMSGDFHKFTEVHAVAELIFNARVGSPAAQTRWREMQLILFNGIEVSDVVLQNLGISTDFVKESIRELTAEVSRLEPMARAYARQQNKLLDEWRKTTGALEALERQQEKLNELILKNDRAGVRRLLDAYLPWVVMEPFEVNSWRTWLEAIENPNPDKAIVALRGLDYETDKIQRLQTAKGEALGMMSTVLTKNQGNYTRRLRSLSVNRRTNGDEDHVIGKAKILSVSILKQMAAHAGDPRASSFLSFTMNPYTARQFIGDGDDKTGKPTGGLLAVKIDQRRLFPNMASIFPTEVEMLAPLIVFPDEVVKYHEGLISDKDLKIFLNEVLERTGVHFDFGKPNSTSTNIKAHRYDAKAYEYLKILHERSPRALACGGIF